MKKVSFISLIVLVTCVNSYLHAKDDVHNTSDDAQKIMLVEKKDQEDWIQPLLKLWPTGLNQPLDVTRDRVSADASVAMADRQDDKREKNEPELVNLVNDVPESVDDTLHVVIRDKRTGAATSLQIKAHDFVEFLRKKSSSSKTSMIRGLSWLKKHARPVGFLVGTAVKYTVSILFSAWIIGSFFHLLADYHVPYLAIDTLVSGSVEIFIDGCSATFRAPEACVKLARMLFGPGGPLNDIQCTTNPLLVSDAYSLCPGVEVPIDSSWMGYVARYVFSWGIGSQ